MIIIAGFGIAAMGAIESLRKRGDERRVLVFGAEPELAYYRPYVGKEQLTELVTHEALHMRPESFFADNQIDLELGQPVLRVHPQEAEIELTGGKHCHYTSLLVCTGGAARRLEVPGADLDGVVRVRTLNDGEALRQRLLTAGSVVVVGGGLLGLDIATTAREMGKDVTLIERAPSLLSRSVSPAMADCVARILSEHGVRVRLQQTVSRLLGRDRVEAVEVGGMTRIAADVVVVAVGIQRSLDCVRGTGIRLEEGVVVGADMRTNIPNVFAAGDVAALDRGDGALMREESFACAYQQGSVAGENIIGASSRYHSVPTFGLMYFENLIRGIGDLTRYDHLEIRGNPKTRSLAAFAITRGTITGIFAVNRPGDAARFMTIVRGKLAATPQVMQDTQ